MINYVKYLAIQAGWKIINGFGTRELIEAPDGISMFIEGFCGEPIYYPLLQQSAIEAIESREENPYRLTTRYDQDKELWATSIIKDGIHSVFRTGLCELTIHSKAIALTYLYEKEKL